MRKSFFGRWEQVLTYRQSDSTEKFNLGRVVFAVMALVSLAIGVALYVFKEQLSLETELAALMAGGFLLAGAVDALIVVKWPRLFGRRDTAS